MARELVTATQNAADAAGSMSGGCIATATPAELDITAHLPVLLVGLRWLFEIEQPRGAVQCPAGDSLPSVQGRGFRFIPADRDGRAALGIAVTTGIVDDAIDGHEIAAFIDLLEGMGEEVVAIDTRAGRSFCTLTLARTAHPTLRRAVARYRAEHVLHANDSPFGPELANRINPAVSAMQLYQQRRNGSTGRPRPVVYWTDQFDFSSTSASTATDPAPHFAAQA